MLLREGPQPPTEATGPVVTKRWATEATGPVCREGEAVDPAGGFRSPLRRRLGWAAVRRLNGNEVAGYDLVSPALARRARVQRTPLLAPGIQGTTVGRLILVLRDDDRSGRRALLAHELVHVQQYAELGAARFLWRYGREYTMNLWRLRNHREAYRAISFEVEARAVTERWAARQQNL